MENDVYSHISLDHSKPSIRLLRVEPQNSPDGLLQCTLSRSTLSAHYYCLSYTWGEPTPCHDVKVNGKVVSVRQNLFDFLRQVRKSKRFDQRLWIDALCIDQTNIAERNHQVQQMGSIYAEAEYVLVWLGNLPGLDLVRDMPRFRGWSHSDDKWQWSHCTRDDYDPETHVDLVCTDINTHITPYYQYSTVEKSQSLSPDHIA